MNAKRTKIAKNATTKLFVLDTNVLMHDLKHQAIP